MLILVLLWFHNEKHFDKSASIHDPELYYCPAQTSTALDHGVKVPRGVLLVRYHHRIGLFSTDDTKHSSMQTCTFIHANLFIVLCEQSDRSHGLPIRFLWGIY